jgi:hypothetical protein
METDSSHVRDVQVESFWWSCSELHLLATEQKDVDSDVKKVIRNEILISSDNGASEYGAHVTWGKSLYHFFLC